MYFNLGLPSCSKPQLTDLLLNSEQLCFDAVAVNTLITTPQLTSENKNQFVPIDLNKIKPKKSANANLLVVENKKPNGRLKQLSRLTFAIADESHLRILNLAPNITNTYDLLAVRPTTESGFKVACTKAEVDIISLDLTQRLPFSLKFNMISVAVSRGLCFEIDLAGCFGSSSVRRNVLSNAISLVRVAKGRNILITCGGRDSFELRSVDDLRNLAKLLQMPTDNATQSLRDIPRACVLHAQTRRAGRGCVMIEDVSADIEWKRANITVDEGQTARGKAINEQTKSNKRKR